MSNVSKHKSKNSGKGVKRSIQPATSDNSDNEEPSIKKPKKQYLQKYLPSYTETWPCLVPSKLGDAHIFCNVCNCDFGISHGGKDDCSKHISRKKHIALATTVKKNTNIGQFFEATHAKEQNDTINAEVLFTQFIVEHNLPISSADHATKLMPKLFPDSTIATKYSCGRSKTTALVHEMAAIKTENLTQGVMKGPYSLATDGSNDATFKQYPLILTHYNSEEKKVTSNLLSISTFEGNSTGENIFNAINSELTGLSIPFDRMLAFGCDNANVMVGKVKGVYGHILKENSKCFLAGCSCHLINLAAQKAVAQHRHLPLSGEK